MDQSSLIFVYGTLKKGFSNHHYLQNKATYLHPFVLEGYQMFLDRSEDLECQKLREKAQTPFDPWPYLKAGEGSVEGELYQLHDQQLLRSLDKLEGVDEGLYQRLIVSTIIGECYLYVTLSPLSSSAHPIRTFTLQDQGLSHGE